MTLPPAERDSHEAGATFPPRALRRSHATLYSFPDDTRVTCSSEPMTIRPTIALTGATGFVGRYLLEDLKRRGYCVRVLLRRPGALFPEMESAVIGDLAVPANLAQAFRGVGYVVHSAGIAHAMSGRPEDDYRTINTEATVALARAAAKAGARRFIFLSSVRAQSGPVASGVLTEDVAAAPTDAYGRSKLAAENALSELGLDWAALRPVLVYGPGVKGNLASLFALARKRMPLPFAGFRARRSLVSLENLAEAVHTAMTVPASPNRAFLVCDPGPVSLAEIVAAYRRGLGRSPSLFYVPPALLTAALSVLGKGEMAERLNGSLVADPSALAALGWRPASETAAALEALGRADRDLLRTKPE